MVGPTLPKTFHSLTIFFFRSPFSTLASGNQKTLAHNFVFPHLRNVSRAFSKTKSILTQLVNKLQIIHLIDHSRNNNNNNNKKKRYFGSFRFHYNWGSSHVLPLPPHVLDEHRVYYDHMWNSVVAAECDDMADAELSGYLHWLEKQVNDDSISDHRDEIDKIADVFIASCHEKFKLEKEESYRKFQEMMDRNL